MKTPVIQRDRDEVPHTGAPTATPLPEPAFARASAPAGLGRRAWAFVRSESGAAQVAAAFIALHVADDTLLQPNAGTSAGDHLVSGLVPIALVAGAAALIGRFRPGARGVTELLLALIRPHRT